MIKELELIFSRNAYPLTLKTDNSPNLALGETKNYLHSKGIDHARSQTSWPRSNEEVECGNQTLLKSIRAIHVKGKNWRSYFNSMLLNNRSTKHAII